MSGVDYNGSRLRKGAGDAIEAGSPPKAAALRPS